MKRPANTREVADKKLEDKQLSITLIGLRDPVIRRRRAFAETKESIRQAL